MTNLNKLSGINSMERRSMEQGRVPYLNEEYFHMVYSPKQTETRKTIESKFAERKELEKERLNLKVEKHDLVKQCDNLQKQLKEVMAQPATTPEEQEAKMSKIILLEVNKKEFWKR